MKFVNCIWELDNLGEHVCEITVSKSDRFEIDLFDSEVSFYDYVVVKVPMTHLDFNFGLTDLGYTMVETQLNISKKYKDFNFEDKLVRLLYSHTDERIVTTEEELELILNRITPDMFSTDRIYLDPHFDNGISSYRYKNWIRTEFKNNSSIISKLLYDGTMVGYSMERFENGVLHGLLGGIFEEEQSEGLGLLTACASFISANKYNRPFKIGKTAISSNNIPMLQIYNYLHFKIDSMTYVFVKHNK